MTVTILTRGNKPNKMQEARLEVQSSLSAAHLEDVEGLKLDVAALVSQHVHHELEVVGLADVFRHHGEVVSIQEQLAEELETGRGGGGVTQRACLEQHVQGSKRTFEKRGAVNLQRLPLGDVVFRMQELLVLAENL